MHMHKCAVAESNTAYTKATRLAHGTLQRPVVQRRLHGRRLVAERPQRVDHCNHRVQHVVVCRVLAPPQQVVGAWGHVINGFRSRMGWRKLPVGSLRTLKRFPLETLTTKHVFDILLVTHEVQSLLLIAPERNTTFKQPSDLPAGMSRSSVRAPGSLRHSSSAARWPVHCPKVTSMPACKGRILAGECVRDSRVAHGAARWPVHCPNVTSMPALKGTISNTPTKGRHSSGADGICVFHSPFS